MRPERMLPLERYVRR